MDKLDIYIGNKNLTVLDAMKKINLNSRGIIYIIDDDKRLIGSLTDGDIRRWIIKESNLSVPVSEICFSNVKYLDIKYSNLAYSEMERYEIHSIPIVNAEKQIVDVIFDGKYEKVNDDKSLHNCSVVIMAGGKGTRLYPYTKILPKPLIPIGDIPILERIMNRFLLYGAMKFYLVVNYKKEMIKSYFKEICLPYEIVYIDETNPLGTAGGISLIKDEMTQYVFITNCDILIDAPYGEILKTHKEMKNDMTIVSSIRNTIIPYGVLNVSEEGIVSSMEEKPSVKKLINTGMYVVNRDHLHKIPTGMKYDMTDLADYLLKKEKRVGTFTIGEKDFLDMGEFEEMKKMENYIMNR